MLKIAAICSCPPLPNPGMASVDLALYNLFKKLGLEKNIKFYTLYSPDERNPNLAESKKDQFKRWQKLPFQYQAIRNQLPNIYKSDIILFWGDFLHSRDYLCHVAETLFETGIEDSLQKSREKIFEYLYLSKAPKDTLSRSFIFGGTLIFNRIQDYRDISYSTALSKLYKNANRVWMRDVYSSLKANKIIGKKGVSTQGVDCALLIDNEELKSLPMGGFYMDKEKDHNVRRAGIFFGRNSGASPQVISFVKKLCENLGVEAEWLPWFAPFVLPNHLNQVLEHFPTLSHYSDSDSMLLGDLLNRIYAYDFIITDTYHACLNSWRMGVPAVCIAEILSTNEHDVSIGWQNAWRDKRQTFYFMHDAMEYFIYKDELMDFDSRKKRLDQIQRLLKSKESKESVTNDIHDFANTIKKDFLESLNKIISDTHV